MKGFGEAGRNGAGCRRLRCSEIVYVSWSENHGLTELGEPSRVRGLGHSRFRALWHGTVLIRPRRESCVLGLR